MEDLQSQLAEKSGLLIDSLTAELLRISEKAEALGDADGLDVARQALMDAAYLNGFIFARRLGVANV